MCAVITRVCICKQRATCSPLRWQSSCIRWPESDTPMRAWVERRLLFDPGCTYVSAMLVYSTHAQPADGSSVGRSVLSQQLDNSHASVTFGLLRHSVIVFFFCFIFCVCAARFLRWFEQKRLDRFVSVQVFVSKSGLWTDFRWLVDLDLFSKSKSLVNICFKLAIVRFFSEP